MCYVHNQWYDISCGTLYQTTIYKIQMNYQIDKNFIP